LPNLSVALLGVLAIGIQDVEFKEPRRAFPSKVVIHRCLVSVFFCLEESSSFSHLICQPHQNLPFRSWSIFKPVGLKFLFSKSGLWASQATFSVDVFYSFKWALLFCFLVCLVIFFVENSTFESSSLVALEIRLSLFSEFIVFLIVLGYLCAGDQSVVNA